MVIKPLDPDWIRFESGSGFNESGSNYTALVGAKTDLKYSDARRDDNGLLAGALQAAVDEVLLEGVQRYVQGLQEVALGIVLCGSGMFISRILIFTHSESRIPDLGSENSNKREG